MGTRADFYVGRGPEAEWIGSIAWDGYPDGIDDAVTAATSEDDYRAALSAFLEGREDASLPADGWPWPWDDSRTTDYAYAFDAGAVWASNYGHPWFKATEAEPERDGEGKMNDAFPDMSERKNATLGPRSGLMVFVG